MKIQSCPIARRCGESARWISCLAAAAALSALIQSPALSEDAKTGRVEAKAEEYGSYYLLDVPEKYSADRSWPLLVALHGAGDNAKNFIGLWSQLAMKEGYLLAVPCGDSKAPDWSDNQRTWSGSSPKFILWVIDQVKKAYRINEERIYLAGFSAGGHMTFYAGLLNPGVFAALVPCSGCVMEEITDSALEKASNLPVRALVGEKDPNFEPVKQSVERLKKAGFKTVILRTFPELAHQYPHDENPKVLQWFDELYAEKLKAKGLTDLLAKAKKAYEEGKYAEAVEPLLKITGFGLKAPVTDEAEGLLKLISETGTARLSQAVEHAKAGRYLEALAAFRSTSRDFAGLDCAKKAAEEEKALMSNPDVRKRVSELEAGEKQAAAEAAAAESLAKAAALQEAGKHAEALKAFDDAAKKFPSTKAGLEAKSRADAMRADKTLMASLDLEKNLKKANSWFQLAENLRKNGKREDALKYYKMIADLVPDTDLGKKAEDKLRELR